MTEFESRFPYIGKTYHSYSEVVPWLESNVGRFDHEWYRYGTDISQGIVAGTPLYDYYRFRDDKSAILFTLRWA